MDLASAFATGIDFTFFTKSTTDSFTTFSMSVARMGEILSFESFALKSAKQASCKRSNCPLAKSASSPSSSSRRFALICFPTAEEDTAEEIAASSSSSNARFVAAPHKSPNSVTIDRLSSVRVLIVSTAVSRALRAAGPNFRAAAISLGDIFDDEEMNAAGEEAADCQKSEATVEAMDSCALAGSLYASKRFIASSAFCTYSTLSKTSLSTETFFFVDTRLARTSTAAASSLGLVVCAFAVTTIKENESVIIPSSSFRMRSIAGPRLSKRPSPLARSFSSA
mmetsp:Transcript_905/g.1909  ORF Transcript_905/g.1909 Transcript_905/m.1909 type:complete len:281 (+) Transcript_905:380-1222(+)